MKHESTKQIKWGMILSYLNLGIGNLIPIFYTPVMLELLGQSEYGLYKMASSTTSYLSLMTFGIGSAVSRFLIKARTNEGENAEAQVFGLFNLLFGGIAFLSLLVGGIIVWNLDMIYGASLNVEELSRMKILVGILVINMSINVASSSYTAVISSHERFTFMQGLNVVTSIITPLLNLTVLYLGLRSIGMVYVSLSLTLVIRACYMFYTRHTLGILPQYRNLPTEMLREIFSFSFWIFVGSLAGQLYDTTDTVIIGAIPELAATGAAVYHVGLMFPQIIASLAQVTPGLFAPKANKMVFSGADNRQLSDLVIKVGRMQSYVVALVVSGFIAFGQPFIAWYVGDDYHLAYWVAVIIMIPHCIPLIQNIALSIMRAKNMHRFRSILYLAIAVVNILLTLLLVRSFGIIGAAIPTGLAMLIGNGLIINIFYWKKMSLDIPLFWRQVLPIFGISIPLCAAALALSKVFDFYVFPIMATGIIAYTAIYCALMWFFIMKPDEKQVIRKLLTRK